MSLQVYYRCIVTDKKGKVVKRTHLRKSHSFVLQFLRIIGVNLDHQPIVSSPTVTAVDTGGVARSFICGVLDAYYNLALQAQSGDSTYGIVVGLGDTPPANADYVLQTPVTHGTGTNQLSHGTVAFTHATVSGANVDMLITRAFINASGATVILKEVGVYMKTYDTSPVARVLCIIRDLLTSDVSVEDGKTVTVQYTFRTTV